MTLKTHIDLSYFQFHTITKINCEVGWLIRALQLNVEHRARFSTPVQDMDGRS